LVGGLAEVAGPRAGLVLGGVAALVAAAVARRAFARVEEVAPVVARAAVDRHAARAHRAPGREARVPEGG
jgi:hypothetical protein